MKNYYRPTLFAGLAVMIIPFLGFPLHIKKILLVIAGLFIVSIAFVMYQRYQARLKKKRERFRPYAENEQPQKTESAEPTSQETEPKRSDEDTRDR